MRTDEELRYWEWWVDLVTQDRPGNRFLLLDDQGNVVAETSELPLEQWWLGFDHITTRYDLAIDDPDAVILWNLASSCLNDGVSESSRAKRQGVAPSFPNPT